MCLLAVTSADITTLVPEEPFTRLDEALPVGDDVKTPGTDDGDSNHADIVVI